MNREHELFGELHEYEENGLFGNEHRRQYEAQQEALRLSAVVGRSEQFYCLNRSIFGDGRKCEKQCLSCEKNIPKQ